MDIDSDLRRRGEFPVDNLLLLEMQAFEITMIDDRLQKLAALGIRL